MPGVGRARSRLELLRCGRGGGGAFKVEACDASGRPAIAKRRDAPRGSALANPIKYPLAPVHRDEQTSGLLVDVTCSVGK